MKVCPALFAWLPLLCWPAPIFGDGNAVFFLAASEAPTTSTQPSANARCSIDVIAGKYRTTFGPLACEATSQGLSCCYGSACQNKVELVFDQAARTMSGTWRYPNGAHGPVVFPVSAQCALAAGRWNYAGRTTPDRVWGVIERAGTKPSASAGDQPAPPKGRDLAKDGGSKPPAPRDQTSPERSRYKVRAALSPSGFEYLDATMTREGDATLQARFLDEISQWLGREGFSCLVTNEVHWTGSNGSAPGRQFGLKRYVIECRDGCEGVRYGFTGGTSPVRPRVHHYGLSKPYPVLEFKSSLFGYDDFEWRFLRERMTESEPNIRIHTWSDRWGDRGPGCSID